MSLNWREIDLVLEELDLENAIINNIIQLDFHSLYFECYVNGKTIWLIVCLQAGMTRIHRCGAPLKTKGLQPRFCEYLRAHIKGAHIISLQQYGQDRIVLMRIVAPEQTITLYIRLWSNAANILAVDEAGIILDALYRRPLKAEISGQPISLPPSRIESEPQNSIRFMVRVWPNDFIGGFNAYIEQLYQKSSQILDFQGLKDRLERQIQVHLTRYAGRKANLQRQMTLAANPERFKQLGEMILSNKHAISRGASWFETEDWYNSGLSVRIELDPRLDITANAERYFQKFQKARDGAQYIRNDLENVQNAESTLAALRLELEKAVIIADLRRVDELLSPFQETGSGQKAGLDSERPGLSYSSRDFLLLIGRNASENDELLRHHVRGNDYWLHVRDFSGGYVFIKVPRTKSVPLEVLVDAAHLAVWYSRAKGEPEVDLFYTQVKYLRRAKHGTYGMVIPTRERNLHISVDQERVNALQASLNVNMQ